MITREQLKKADEAKIQAAYEARKLREAFAIQECPFSIGDIVDVCGYSYEGKKMKIDSILPSRY